MAAPIWTYNTQGNIRAAASLAAGANAAIEIDLTAKIEGQLTVRVVLGGTVATVHGIRTDILPRYGTTPSLSTVSRGGGDFMSTDIGGAVGAASYFIGSGLWTVRVTNLDTVNVVTLVEITLDTLDGIE
jgi:hypothetical protein